MSFHLTRRRFVSTAVQGGLLAGLADVGFVNNLPAARAADTPALPAVASVSSDIEPLVRLIEDTPRAELTDKVIEKIRKGTSYQELMSAVFLAGVRGIQPRPVGFKFHAVLVINSAHLAAQAAPDRESWLPLLWSIDYFKDAQAQNAKQGNWRMKPVEESKLPSAHDARKYFVEGMDDWNPEQVDRGIVALSRSAGAAEVFETLWRYGARDFRDIGHKAIFAANAWRTLQAIGWRHAEPVLRSLTYAMLEHESTNPAKRDDSRDRPGRDNLPRVLKLKEFSSAGKRDAAVAGEVVKAIRTASAADASNLVLELIEKGIHPACIWEGLFLSAGELLMRQPGIGGLHTLTTMNAMHFAYQTSGVGPTRAYMLVQAAAFLPLFRQFMNRDKLADVKIIEVEKAEGKPGIDEIMDDVARNKMSAARKTLALLEASPDQLEPLMHAARRLIFAKTNGTHDYKFSSAVLEDVYHLPPALRPRFMAASMFYMRGTGDRDNALVKRVRGALAKA